MKNHILTRNYRVEKPHLIKIKNTRRYLRRTQKNVIHKTIISEVKYFYTFIYYFSLQKLNIKN